MPYSVQFGEHARPGVEAACRLPGPAAGTSQTAGPVTHGMRWFPVSMRVCDTLMWRRHASRRRN